MIRIDTGAFERATAMVRLFGTTAAEAGGSLRRFGELWRDIRGVVSHQRAPVTLRRRGPRGRARVVRDALRSRGVCVTRSDKTTSAPVSRP